MTGFNVIYVIVPAVSSDDEAVIRKTEFTSKMDAQSQSPSKRSGVKPAARQTRPTHHSCPRRRPTGDPPKRAAKAPKPHL